MRGVRITTVLLVLLNAALTLWVVVLWNRGQARVTEPARLSIPPLSLPDLTALNSPPMPSVDVAAIREQAPFYTSRAFYRPPAETAAVPPPEYEMTGTLRLADGKRIAFVRKTADRSSRTLHVSDDLEGWRVAAIDPERIVLSHDDQTAQLHSGGSAPGGAPGLIRGPTPPRTAQTGIHVLGAAGPGALQPGGQARVYHPPPGN
jgi:hypothetical protein